MLSRKNWTKISAVTLGLLAGSMAFGQISSDFPNLKGDNQRTGSNGNPNLTGPGRALLHWFAPQNGIDLTDILLDNTDFGNTRANFPGQGPFDPTLFGSSVQSTTYNPLNPTPNRANEFVPPAIGDEAAFPFLESIRTAAQTIGINNYPVSYSSRFPAYVYTNATPSSLNLDPTKGTTPADVRTFRYIFQGAPGVPKNYALYAWLPVGPTKEAGTGASIYPQRYFVYEVRSGPAGADRFVDIIDTYASGGGWVRIGNHGAATNAVFPWDGTNPIRMYLYNTVPRNDTGALTMPHGTSENDVKKYVVYADAAKAVPTSGYYTATPTTGHLNDLDPNSMILLDPKSELSVGTSGGGSRTVATGGLTARFYNNLTKAWEPRWKYTPVAEQGGSVTTLDNSVAATAGVVTTDTTSTRYLGTDVYLMDAQAAADASVNFAPTLNDGTYEVFAYLPGDNNGFNFAQKAQYTVTAEGTTFTYEVDQSLAGGWVKIGNRRFTQTAANPISVILTNQSALPADLTKKVYADSIRFVGERNQEVSSSPVFATANIRLSDLTIASKKVVIMADESGVIHCLDASGNADGTTTEYWSYPSNKTPDPNQVNGEDGVGGVAEMATGFELSTAVVQKVAGVDYLFIGSRNGRVYCIDMTGRGDYGVHTSGTTSRKWTYPSTYPTANPVASSTLGSFRGSLLFTNTGGSPTIYVPTTQGRMYALDAKGKADKSTTVRWTYPALTQPTLGPIYMTPSIRFGSLYFGTLRKDSDPGRFFSLNAATGGVNWEFASGAVESDDWLASPAVIDYNTVTGVNNPGGIIYTVNQNRVFYAIDALTGAILWQTSELGVGARGAITYTHLSAYNNVGTLTDTPIVMVPTLDGRFVGMFANPDYTFLNRFGSITSVPTKTVSGKRAYEYVAAGDSITSSIAVANGFMFGADNAGFIYAWADTSGNLSGQQPGQETVVENNPAGDIFRKAKMKLVTSDAYSRLRLPLGDPQQLTYLQALTNAFSFTRTPLAFEWGETAYIMVYDFPMVNESPNGNPVPPPIVNVSFNVDGRTIRGVAVEARQFANVANGNPPKLSAINPLIGTPAPPDGDRIVDGYAIVAFPFQGGGANALPPGDAAITFSISTQGLNNNGAQQNVVLDPTVSSIPFKMANPIAVSMSNSNPTTATNDAIGIDVVPSGAERLTNGTPPIPTVGGSTKAQLGKSTGFSQDGQTKSATVYVFDVSMMGLLRPDGMGLDGVRLERADLSRQGGSAGVYKALNSALYAGFEDYPINSPNTSLDYPDIGRENVRATKDPNGDAENPLFNGVQLLAPLIKKGGQPARVMQEGDKPEDRIFVATPFLLDVDVPRYQPPVDFSSAGAQATAVPDSLGNTYVNSYKQGYMGRINVFVDSFQNGNLDATQREAYRSFSLATAVAPNEQIAVTTPSIDLGALAGGAGFSALATPGNGFNPQTAFNDRIFDPWNNRASAQYPGLFKPFTVQNRGNVNLLNLRLAKGYDARLDNPSNPNTAYPFKIASAGNDTFAWLESGWDSTGNSYSGNLWSDLDYQFSPWLASANVDRNVILQKPRVTDRVPTELTVNARRRANANIPVIESSLFPNQTKWPVREPRVGVSIPLGFPVGRYTQRLRVIEDSNVTSRIFPTWDLLTSSVAETASDPTFDLFFTVRETRLTSSYTTGTDRQIDDQPTSPTTGFTNQQPTAVRDANGSLIMAFATNRPNWNYGNAVPTSASPYSIYIASLDNNTTFGGAGFSQINNQKAPLRDLNNWNPASNAGWWRKEVQNFPPQSPNGLFGAVAGETMIPESLRYTNPSFPQAGAANPFSPGTNFNTMLMAFIGEGQKSTASGRLTESKLMVTSLTIGADGSVTAVKPIVNPGNPYALKGKPSVVQTSTGGMFFFAGSSGGQSQIFYSRLAGLAFGPTTALPVGSGFDSVSHPSAAARLYNGASAAFPNGVVELTFNGKLHGRSSTEVFLGRMPVTNNLSVVESPANSGIVDDANVFADMQPQNAERIVPDNGDTFRSRGVVWNLNTGFTLNMSTNGGATVTNILIDSTRTYDSSTGILSYSTKLGGKAYIDPNLGTIRFAGGTPSKNAILQLTYQPRFLRVTAGGTAGYADATGLWDGRLISDPYDLFLSGGTYGSQSWRHSDGTIAAANDGAGEKIRYHNDRLTFTYTRAAAGSGSAARPYISSFRLGVRLPTKIETDSNGLPVKVVVTGNTGPYQIDASQGRIYFTDADEDRNVQIDYYGVDDAGNPVPNTGGGRDLIVQSPATWVGERTEEPILIEQAVNEAGLSSFLDPFNYLTDPRPPLVWLFWSSTRAGQPDIYFESIAPQWNPVLVGK